MCSTGLCLNGVLHACLLRDCREGHALECRCPASGLGSTCNGKLHLQTALIASGLGFLTKCCASGEQSCTVAKREGGCGRQLQRAQSA
jgi:hypothetical protein